MKVLILSPYFYPEVNGLADYSTLFSENLKKDNHEVDIICNEGLGEGFSPFFTAKKWNISTFIRLFWAIHKEQKNWDRIIIQFVPHMYAPKGGLVPSLGIFSLLLRCFCSPRLQVMFHELHYPFSFYWKDFLMWCCHHFMYLLCLWSSHDSFFSTQTNLKKGRLMALFDNTHWLPVASNLPRSPSKGRGDQKLEVCLFGGQHISKRYDLVFEALYQSRENREMLIHFIGPNLSDLDQGLREHPIAKHIEFHGRCDAKRAAAIISQCHVMVAYFSDGISSRRGSAMAALNQGIHLLSTYDWGSEELFQSWPNICLLPTGPNAFIKEAKAYLSSFSFEEVNEDQRKLYQDHFDQFFSWQAIMSRYYEV